jgi:hypothetical protein
MTMSACGWQSLRAPEPPERELTLPPPQQLENREATQLSTPGLKSLSHIRCHHLVKTFWGWRDQQLPDGTGSLGRHTLDCRSKLRPLRR